MRTVEKCFCFSLQTTGIVFGWLGGFLSVIIIIVLACLLEYLQNSVELIEANATDANRNFLLASRIKIDISIFVACIGVVNHVALAWGSITKREKLLVPWLVATPIFAAQLLGTMIFVAINTDDPTILIPTTMVLLLSAYLWVAMMSLYVKIKTENESRPEPCIKLP